MPNIRAFVGHSFLDEDEAIVRKFTDFFDLIKKMHDFDWVHATDPRADDVATKVLNLIEGRNLFIGICTANECVSKKKNFINVFFGDFLKIKPDNLQIKASDWIIQEIGLAVGLKMKIILLLERGVRQPGSLQGNLEYIVFDRGAIERSFPSILGMISNIQGTGLGSAHDSGATIERSASDEEQKENLIQENELPNENWEDWKFGFEHLKAVILKDSARARIVSDAWLSRVVSDPEAVASWEVSSLLDKTRYGDENHLAEIRAIASKYPNNSKMQRQLAQTYEYFEDYGRARECYQNALGNSVNIDNKRDILASLAEVCQKLGDNNGVESAIADLRSLVASPEDEAHLLSTLEQLAPWKIDNKMLGLALMEREIAIDPTNTRKRFQLAYAHSQEENTSITMYHYEKIPFAQRDPITWNNLGVAYQEFGLSSLSVSASRIAADQGETLAMSNLAEKLMSAGFLKEAKDELGRAKDAANVHQNIAKSQVRLDSIRTHEEEKNKKDLIGAQELSEFLSLVGHCLWQSAPPELGVTWSDKDVSFLVNKEDDRVLANGSLQKKEQQLAFSLH